MTGLYFLLPTFLVVLISFLVVRAAAIALMFTGMDDKRAKFQALSAFTGTGFTTKEAESVVSHPARRRIITWLMILGNAGIVIVIVTTTSSLVKSIGYQLPINVLLLIAGLYAVYKIATNKGIIRRWESFLEDKFAKSETFEEGVSEDLLHFIEGYGLIRVIINEKCPFIDSTLLDCKLRDRGVIVLGIERGKRWMPNPEAREIIKNGDKVVVYGPLKVLRDLFEE